MRRVGYVFAAALGASVTLALLLLMHSLISTGDRALDESTPIRIADITMPETRIEAEVAQQLPARIDEPERPPAAPAPDPQVFDAAGGIVVNLAPEPAEPLEIGPGPGASSSDGEYLPIVKVAAVYPRRAQLRGITGYCIVEYTVTITGATRDPQAVDCQPQGVFEETSVKAALKFKYRPRVIDGQPVEVRGVRNQFLYELDR
jgi:protein TonB